MYWGFNCQCACRFIELSEKHKFCCIYRFSNAQILSLGFILKPIITKGYGVWATTIEGQNAFGPTLCFV